MVVMTLKTLVISKHSNLIKIKLQNEKNIIQGHLLQTEVKLFK